jgi:hypothetical protein
MIPAVPARRCAEKGSVCRPFRRSVDYRSGFGFAHSGADRDPIRFDASDCRAAGARPAADVALNS